VYPLSNFREAKVALLRLQAKTLRLPPRPLY